MDRANIEWIPEGTAFGQQDITWYAGRDDRDIDAALADIDLIITGPHASAAFPAEMAPFVDTGLTRRLQFDFTDVSTSPVGRRWAEIDPHVLYIEDPHPRAVRDANRARPSDILVDLRDAFARLEAAPGERPSLTGIDAIRPVTFGYLPVLRKPTDDTEWDQLGSAFTKAGKQGVDAYERIRDELIERVIEAKIARLASIDPATSSVEEWNSATHLDVLSLHDTMNHTAQPDGAICVERKPVDRLPQVVALSNRGDANGEYRAGTSIRSEIDVPTMLPARMRAIGQAYRIVFDAHGADDVAYNRPYLGGYETQLAGPMLRDLEPRCVVRTAAGPPRALKLGAWQNEFLREFLLGDDVVNEMRQPGVDWVNPPDDRVQWLAEKLRDAHALVRRWGSALDTLR